MLDITPLISKETKFISAYGKGFFEISNERVDGAIFIFRENFSKILEIEKSFEKNEKILSLAISARKKYDIIGVEPIILIVGSGSSHNFPDKKIFSEFFESNILPEFMSTPAACRTYNVLVTEGRNVAAILLPI